jgi:hypothetical protein
VIRTFVIPLNQTIDSAVCCYVGLPGQFAVALALAVTVLLGGSQAHAGAADAVSSGSHTSVWRESDVGLYLDGSLPKLPDVGDAVITAIETWTSADTRLPRVWPIIGVADELGYRPKESNRNTVRYAPNGEPRALGALAITLVTSDSEQTTILDGDIVLNGIYQFDSSGQSCGQRCSNGNRDSYNLGDVLSHEFGHWFGLPDNLGDTMAIMYPYFNSGEKRRWTLSDGDKQALNDLYSASSASENKSISCSVGTRGHYRHPGGVVGLAVVLLALLLRLANSLVCWSRNPTSRIAR